MNATDSADGQADMTSPILPPQMSWLIQGFPSRKGRISSPWRVRNWIFFSLGHLSLQKKGPLAHGEMGLSGNLRLSTLSHPPSMSLRLRSEEHTSELQSHSDLVCRLLLEKKN